MNTLMVLASVLMCPWDPSIPGSLIARPEYLDAKAYRTIADPRTTEETLLYAIRRLGNVGEPPEFWTRIANDQKYSDKHRGYCVLQLFERHIRSGMTLGELNGLLQGAKWLHEGSVYRFFIIGGYVPVEGSPSCDSIFSVHVSPLVDTRAVYISVPGKISSRELIGVLRDKTVDPQLRDVVILDVWPRRR